MDLGTGIALSSAMVALAVFCLQSWHISRTHKSEEWKLLNSRIDTYLHIIDNIKKEKKDLEKKIKIVQDANLVCDRQRLRMLDIITKHGLKLNEDLNGK